MWRVSWKLGHLLAKPYWLGDLISTVTAVCLLRCSMVVSLIEALIGYTASWLFFCLLHLMVGSGRSGCTRPMRNKTYKQKRKEMPSSTAVCSYSRRLKGEEQCVSLPSPEGKAGKFLFSWQPRKSTFSSRVEDHPGQD